MTFIFQMDKIAIGDVSSHHLLGAAFRVHAVGLLVRVGRLLPVPLGPHLSLSHPRPHLVHHGLGTVAHCSGEISKKVLEPDL